MTMKKSRGKKKKGRRTPIDNPESAARVVSQLKTISQLREAATECKACDLWKKGTQTIFGEGPASASILFVGEQPGDQEDLSGHPFVGPAGKVLDRALDEAGIDRSEVYVTNVVKHFNWEPSERGKRRIHKKPNSLQIRACWAWIEAELRVVRPRVLVCLGATAAKALLGREFGVKRQRGQLVDSTLAPYAVATVHPSSILRAPDDESRHSQMREFVNDLRKVRKLLRKTEA
jgi:uracil-DNA glycosylase